MKIRQGLMYAAACAIISTTANAQSQTGTIRLIAPFTPGGIVDSTARIMAEAIQKELNQPVIVENMPGAGGQIGADRVARSAPDGLTLLITGNGIAYRHLIVKLPYDPLRQLEPVSQIVTSPVVIVAHPSIPAKNLTELVQYAKAHPLRLGNSGAGGPTHLMGELLGYSAGIQVTNVPYRGDSAAIADAVAGNVDGSVSSVSATKAFISAGRLRAIAVASTKRASALPDTQTTAEAGMPELAGDVWVAMLAPAGLPMATLDRLSGAITRACADPKTRGKLEATGSSTVCGSPQELASVLRSDFERWKALLQTGKIKIEQ